MTPKPISYNPKESKLRPGFFLQEDLKEKFQDFLKREGLQFISEEQPFQTSGIKEYLIKIDQRLTQVEGDSFIDKFLTHNVPPWKRAK